jgi:hypothetical protein
MLTPLAYIRAGWEDIMKKLFVAAALATAPAQPASAITFPSLTTIYVASGVRNTESAPNTGIATVIHCTNVSGAPASVRFQVLNFNGAAAGTPITDTVFHGFTHTVATHLTVAFAEDTPGALSPGVSIAQGAINIESTQSAVFCSAMIVDAAAVVPSGIDLHLVRVNPHPGTVE